jgi:hypothetical protein
MRITLIASILAIGVMHHETIRTEAKALMDPGDSAEIHAALQVRCGDAVGLERRHCEADLREAIANGTSDAGTIVRLHCTHFDNRWSAERAREPVCAAMHEG